MLYRCLRPLLFRLDAERAHGLTCAAAESLSAVPGAVSALAAGLRYEHPALAGSAFGLQFANPIGLAAGFDKDGKLAAPLAALGFGFLELGTVTPRPQAGNPLPRLFRLPLDEGVINRMGFNTAGAEALARRVGALRTRRVPLGINVGKNKDTPLERATEDYVSALRTVYRVSDYIVVNVSSPNTPGLRSLQQASELRAMLAAVSAERDRLAEEAGRRVPVLVKFAPDLAQAELEAAVQTSLDTGADGLIATNTTLRRDGLRSPHRDESGGLSGRPLFPWALETVRSVAAITQGRVPIVGVGGIGNASDAYAFIQAGAALVQLYTALVYQGPGLVRSIKRGLVKLLERDGFDSVAQAVGTGP